ncbi:hypothetical protein RJT34_20353 [Clitoria ternatea]|uniref:Uncharacterized protein n=1 Tax=Clitoria ternatea TaxID=43366 RepID=A0AAN9ISR8_CLITE
MYAEEARREAKQQFEIVELKFQNAKRIRKQACIWVWKGKRGKQMDVKLMASVSDCLDKYKVFPIEQLVEATDGFHESCLIEGSVYKGSID